VPSLVHLRLNPKPGKPIEFLSLVSGMARLRNSVYSATERERVGVADAIPQKAAFSICNFPEDLRFREILHSI
jgi:hypothetical protein